MSIYLLLLELGLIADELGSSKSNGERSHFTHNFGLYGNMVRIIVGTLLSVGQGKLDPDSIPEILAKQNRQFAGKMAPGHGLYLWEVNYNN